MNMKRLLIAIPLLALCGCAVTRPHVLCIETDTNGCIISRKEIWLPAFVVWPGTQVISKQRGSIAKTVSAGVVDSQQDSGGTNLVDALRAIGGILNTIRP